ncbi:MAG: DNA-processing protein DprA [Clostridia bacterium]|nr:DNA-processing protein DprA [Clostridia bacterium]
MEINHHVLWLWIKESLSYNNKKTLKLIEFFNSVHAVYEADDFSECRFLTEKEQHILGKKNLRSAWEIYGECEENQIGILTLDDSLYPSLLLEITNPPSPLFFKGHLRSYLEQPLLTVVGTRKSTGYGEEMTKQIVTALCQCGFSVVCGIADGIDRFARESVLRANSGPLVVLPFGHLFSQGMLTRDFPDILVHGAILSEVFPRNGSHKYSYHERNRILSGLSHGTLVVQAPKRSGALMTANYAIEQNRDLFAVMSNACPESEGSNQLIKDGCYPVTEYTDILQVYLPQFGDQLKELTSSQEQVFSLQQELTEDKLAAYKKKYSKNLSDAERAVFSLLSTEECTTDDLIEKSGLPVEQVLQILTTLEFQGLAVSCPGSKFKVIL